MNTETQMKIIGENPLIIEIKCDRKDEDVIYKTFEKNWICCSM